MQNNASFLAMLEQPCMITRLKDELQEALREFREDPRAYIKSALKDEVGGSRRRMLLRVGLAIGILFYALAFISMLVFWSLAHQRSRGSNGERPTYVVKLPGNWPKAKMPEGEDKSGGGGGGGRKTVTPPSIGALPISSLVPPILAPSPETPLKPPLLPVIETVTVDPRIQFKRDEISPTGLPDATSFIPSFGPGLDNGMGTGPGGGMGPGRGPGVGPGDGGNTGGNGFNIGGKPKSNTQQPAVDSRPILMNQPRPFFTEEARKNKVQGVVRVRVLVDASGQVKEVLITRGLPDGLNEQAIRAAYQMRFKPAMKDGHPVSYWLGNVEIEFNLR